VRVIVSWSCRCCNLNGRHLPEVESPAMHKLETLSFFRAGRARTLVNDRMRPLWQS
jgi:hypothetical protein